MDCLKGEVKFGLMISFETNLNSSDGFQLREDRPAINWSKVARLGSIIEYIVFTEDMVESPILGKLTWSQEVLIHNPHDTRQETALQLKSETFTHTHTC